MKYFAQFIHSGCTAVKAQQLHLLCTHRQVSSDQRLITAHLDHQSI